MNDVKAAHRIVIEFASGDSTDYNLSAENIIAAQFFVAEKVCGLMGTEYWQRQRMSEMMAAEESKQSGIIQVARSFEGLKNDA